MVLQKFLGAPIIKTPIVDRLPRLPQVATAGCQETAPKYYPIQEEPGTGHSRLAGPLHTMALQKHPPIGIIKHNKMEEMKITKVWSMDIRLHFLPSAHFVHITKVTQGGVEQLLTGLLIIRYLGATVRAMDQQPMYYTVYIGAVKHMACRDP